VVLQLAGYEDLVQLGTVSPESGSIHPYSQVSGPELAYCLMLSGQWLLPDY
jgi:hypothetical protein